MKYAEAYVGHQASLGDKIYYGMSYFFGEKKEKEGHKK